MRSVRSCFSPTSIKDAKPSPMTTSLPAADAFFIPPMSASASSAGAVASALWLGPGGVTQSIDFPPFLEGNNFTASSPKVTKRVRGFEVTRILHTDGRIEECLGGTDVRDDFKELAAVFGDELSASFSKNKRKALAAGAILFLLAGAAVVGGAFKNAAAVAAPSPSGLAATVAPPPPPQPACPSAGWWLVTPDGFETTPSAWQSVSLKAWEWSAAAAKAASDKAGAAVGAGKKLNEAMAARVASSPLPSAWARVSAAASKVAATGRAKAGAVAGAVKSAGTKAAAQVQAAAAAVRANLLAPAAAKVGATTATTRIKLAPAVASAKAFAASKAQALTCALAPTVRAVEAAWVAGAPASARTARASIQFDRLAGLRVLSTTAGAACVTALLAHRAVVVTLRAPLEWLSSPLKAGGAVAAPVLTLGKAKKAAVPPPAKSAVNTHFTGTASFIRLMNK